jgi:hypothetical protein
MINEALKSELNSLMLPFADRPINSGMMLAMHIKLYIFAIKRFPELAPTEINDQIKIVITELVKNGAVDV